jgi:hypothetical protein
MRIRLALLAGVAVTMVGLATAPASAVQVHYCRGTEYRGEYLIAAHNVGCGKAQEVSEVVRSSDCIHRTRCRALGFRCRSYNGHDYHHPFSVTKFATCNASHRRHVEFDFS